MRNRAECNIITVRNNELCATYLEVLYLPKHAGFILNEPMDAMSDREERYSPMPIPLSKTLDIVSGGSREFSSSTTCDTGKTR